MRYTSLTEGAATTGVPDLRGWAVRDADDRRIGSVADVLLGEDGAPRYLDVRAGGLLDPRRVLLPVGVVSLDDARETVAVRGMRNDAIRALPEYVGDSAAIDDEFEGRLRLSIPTSMGGDIFSTRYLHAPPAEIATPAESETTAAGRRPLGDIPIVAKERADAAPAASSATPAEAGVEEIRVPIVEEEVVVHTRPVVREELVIRKHAVEDTKTVETEVRREVVDVREHGRTR